MQEIIIRAGCFIAIIILGYVLRKIGVFKQDDFKVLSKIVLKITLPAAIITSFAGKKIDAAMLSIAFIGFGGGLLYMFLGYIMNRQKGKEWQAFGLLNLSGYNIGNFTMPFVQSFLGPMGVITTSVYDVGNAFVCLGGAYGVSKTIKGSGRFSVVAILKTLTKSVAFDCYLVMIVMSLANFQMPAPVIDLAKIIADANAFVAMLMLGVGFRLSGDKTQTTTILKYLLVRYGIAAALAVGCYNLLPFPLEVRQALVILTFSPIASAVPAFTGEMDGDVGLSSAINSLSIVCSIVIIVGILLFML